MQNIPFIFSREKKYRLARHLAFWIVAAAVLIRLEYSRLGLQFAAIKQSEAVARAVGIHTIRCKLLVLTLSGFLAGAAASAPAVLAPAGFGRLLQPLTVFHPEWVGRRIDAITSVLSRFRDRPGALAACFGGAVFVQAGGNVFLRDLGEQESLLVKPPALLYKDPSVAIQMHVEFPHAGMKLWRSWGNRYLWLRVWGPGRVALQSSYDRLEDPGTDFRDSCAYSQQIW